VTSLPLPTTVVRRIPDHRYHYYHHQHHNNSVKSKVYYHTSNDRCETYLSSRPQTLYSVLLLSILPCPSSCHLPHITLSSSHYTCTLLVAASFYRQSSSRTTITLYLPISGRDQFSILQAATDFLQSAYGRADSEK
jgi:hypothetical protein